MTEEIKAAISENPKLGLVKVIVDSVAEISVKFGVWVVVAMLGLGVAYWKDLDAKEARAEAKEARLALVEELKSGRDKLSGVVQENSESYRRLAESINQMNRR